ncbi:MAG: thioesterase domain-containing protein [Fuerstiella sp.]
MLERLKQLTIEQRRELAIRLNESQPPHLTAYYSVEKGAFVDESQLREHLSALLPNIMIPRSFMAVDELPRTDTGKIDRRATLQRPVTVRPCVSDVPKESSLHAKIRDVWVSITGAKDFDSDQSFFEIGGDSLGLIKAVAMSQDAGLDVTPALMYKHPTLNGLAEAVTRSKQNLSVDKTATVNRTATPGTTATATPNPVLQTRTGADSSADSSAVSDDFNRFIGGEEMQGPIRLSHDDTKPIMFFLPPHGKDLGLYQQLTLHIKNYTCFGPFILGDHIEDDWTVDQIASEFLEQIQSIQPTGPYRLFGFCDGAYVGWEIARRLNAKGEKVNFLGNIDTPNPDTLTTVRESFPVRIRKRVNEMNTQSVVTFVGEFARICAKWINARVHFRLTGQRHLIQGGTKLSWQFSPEPYNGHLTLFQLPKSSSPTSKTDHAYGWADLAMGGVDVVSVLGNREDSGDYIFNGEHAKRLSVRLESAAMLADQLADR